MGSAHGVAGEVALSMTVLVGSGEGMLAWASVGIGGSIDRSSGGSGDGCWDCDDRIRRLAAPVGGPASLRLVRRW